MKKKTKKRINGSDLVSGIALLVSIVSIYFTFFYQNHNLTISVIDSDVEYNGNTISIKLLHQNRGNTYSTIIQNYLTFYQNVDWANKGVIFDKGEHILELKYDPIILIPGEQVLKHLDTETNFKSIDTNFRKLNLKNKINVGLVSIYINENGLRSSDMFKIGNIELDSIGNIFRYNMNYKVFELNGENHYSGANID